MTAQRKEVRVHVVNRGAQHDAEDLGEIGFELGPRSRAGVGAQYRHRQCASVQFPGVVERELGQHRDGRGDHVVGQPAGELLDDRRHETARIGGGIRGNHPRDQSVSGRGDGRTVDDREIPDGRLDLTDLDPVAAQLDLGVGATHVLEQPVASSHDVAGSVHTRTGDLAGRVGDEGGSGQPTAAEIAAGQGIAADVQFAHRSVRDAAQGTVEHQKRGGRDRSPDGHRGPCGIGRGELIGDHDGGLGGAVGIDQREVRCRRQHPVGQVRGEGLATGDDATQAAVAGHHRNEQVQQRRHEHRCRHTEFGDDLRLPHRITVHTRFGHQGCGSADEGQHQFPDGAVEADGCLDQDGVTGTERIAGHRGLPPGQYVDHTAVVDDDALGPSRRPGGVHDVGGIAGRGARHDPHIRDRPATEDVLALEVDERQIRRTPGHLDA